MKFCTQKQILNWKNVTLSKMKKLHWTDSEFDKTYFLFPYIILSYYIIGLQIQATWHALSLGLRIRHVSPGEGESFFPQTSLGSWLALKTSGSR